MRRALLMACLALAWMPASGQVPAPDKPAEYTSDEFPDWALDLRRAEILTAGAFPFVFLFSGLGYDLTYWSFHGFDQSYTPWPVGPGTSGWTYAANATDLATKNLLLVTTSLGLSLAIAAADWAVLHWPPQETP